MFEVGTNGNVNYKSIISSITDWAMEEKEIEGGKIGVLICEGDENSIDKAVYQVVFPDLLVVPVGGYTVASRILPKIRDNLSKLGMYAFAIIDRDTYSEEEMINLSKERGIYTTKLPFIENIICSPEVLKHVAEYLQINYHDFVNKVKSELLKILLQKLKEAVPFNFGFMGNESVMSIKICASTKSETVEQIVDKKNILYSYRDKIVCVVVGNQIGLKGKKAYYEFMIDLINNEEYTEALAHSFSQFIPELELYNFD